jgi:hypothetical protein
MTDLTLETKTQTNRTGVLSVGDQIRTQVLITPSIDEDYWQYRVRLSDRQSIVGFPKFGTIGIGFAVEDDWNTNLPYTCETQKIYDHIAHNKGDDSISPEDCVTAIQMVQQAATADRDGGAQ